MKNLALLPFITGHNVYDKATITHLRLNSRGIEFVSDSEVSRQSPLDLVSITHPQFAAKCHLPWNHFISGLQDMISDLIRDTTRLYTCIFIHVTIWTYILYNK